MDDGYIYRSLRDEESLKKRDGNYLSNDDLHYFKISMRSVQEYSKKLHHVFDRCVEHNIDVDKMKTATNFRDLKKTLINLDAKSQNIVMGIFNETFKDFNDRVEELHAKVSKDPDNFNLQLQRIEIFETFAVAVHNPYDSYNFVAWSCLASVAVVSLIFGSVFIFINDNGEGQPIFRALAAICLGLSTSLMSSLMYFVVFYALFLDDEKSTYGPGIYLISFSLTFSALSLLHILTAAPNKKV